jgi:PAS domain-containing protein
LSEVLPARLMSGLEPRYRAALAGEHRSFDYRSHDGRNGYWAQITPVRGGDGAVTSVVAVMQDVTDRLGTIEELSRSEARPRESERMAGVGSWEMTPGTGSITYSQGFASVFGLSPDDQFDVNRFIEMVHPDDRQLVADANAHCLATGSVQREYRIVRPNGPSESWKPAPRRLLRITIAQRICEARSWM